MNAEVVIVPYSAEWPRLFATEADRIRRALALPGLPIEHIGSTSVPGLAAKPIVDLAVQVPDPVGAVPALQRLGYVARGEFGLPGRQFFTLGDPVTVHAHLVAPGSPHWSAWVLFRDAIRRDATLCDRYETLKRELAVRHAGNRPAYTAAKSDFINRVVEAERARTVQEHAT